MAKLNKFRTDLNASNEGVDFDMGDGLTVTIAREGNENYQRYLREALKPYQSQLTTKTPSEAFVKAFEKIQNEAIGTHIIVGWAGLEDDNGKAIPYSAEKAIEIVSNPEFKDFKEDVMKIAGTSEFYRKEFVDQTKSKA